jgi:hypothetical protein
LPSGILPPLWVEAQLLTADARCQTHPSGRSGATFKPAVFHLQVEAQLLATDDRFLRLHGVPAGRALDLFGRTLGAAEGDNSEAPRSGRHPVAKLPPSASALRWRTLGYLIIFFYNQIKL